MSPPSPERRPRRHRLASAAVLAIGIGAGLAPTVPVAAQDRTAAWLEDRGLDELLARHLETALEEARGDQAARARVAGRLARTYARILRTIDDEERRAAVVTRSRQMLSIVPEEDAGELRVALVRNRYVRASQVMEDDRIGIADQDEIDAAVDELGRIAGELERVRKQAAGEIRQAGKARGRQREDRLSAAIELAAASGLLEAWSRYYLGRSTGTRDQYELAQLALGTVLQGESPIPDDDEVSFDLQAAEGFANAILANAMVTSALSSPSAAAPWFDRLDMTVTHERVRRSAPGWRLAALIDAGEYAEARTRFDEMVARSRQEGDASLPVAWIRLAAVGGLRGVDEAPAALRLAESALAALAARGELAQVRSLAEAFGLDALGQQGFVFAYVRGLERHRASIEARDAGDQAGARAGFTETVDLLRKALVESDAVAFPEASASATLMIGWSLLELDRTAEAADAFEDAAGRLAGGRRADALWGAIVALDRIVSEGRGGEGTDEVLARRDALAERFLDAYPADDRSPSLVVRRIAEEEAPDDEDLDVLLGVPESHPTWETARRRVVQVLYREFRQATDDEVRVDAGRRMLDIADELLDREREGDGLFTDLRGLDGMLLRQAAEVSTDERVHEASRAERYLAQLERALEHGALAEVPDLPNEILYRRLGLALGDGDFEFAARLLDQMPAVPDTPEADRWTRLSALRIHRAADALMKSGGVSVDVARAGAEAGTRYLEAVAGNEGDTGNEDGTETAESKTSGRFTALDQERYLPIAASVAGSWAAIFEAGGDRGDGEEALAWYRAILERRPRDGSVLAATGRVAAGLGETEVALDAWRRLVRAAPEGGELWWQAKVGQIRALLETDPSLAREVFDQMAVLHPELGPAPFDEQLRDLDIRIDVALDAGPPASGGDS